MSLFAVYRTSQGYIQRIVESDPTATLAPDEGVSVIAQAPDDTHVWDRWSRTLVTTTPRPDDKQYGVFHQFLTDEGWTWYYHVGPVAFQVKATTQGQSAQPTVNQAKAYAAANSTDEQFHTALTWLLNYRDRLAVALAAAGVSDPTTNARYQKCQTLAGVIGGML